MAESIISGSGRRGRGSTVGMGRGRRQDVQRYILPRRVSDSANTRLKGVLASDRILRFEHSPIIAGTYLVLTIDLSFTPPSLRTITFKLSGTRIITGSASSHLPQTVTASMIETTITARIVDLISSSSSGPTGARGT